MITKTLVHDDVATQSACTIRQLRCSAITIKERRIQSDNIPTGTVANGLQVVIVKPTLEMVLASLLH